MSDSLDATIVLWSIQMATNLKTTIDKNSVKPQSVTLSTSALMIESEIKYFNNSSQLLLVPNYAV